MVIRSISAYGINILNLVEDHVGLSFNPIEESQLTNVLITTEVLSSTFQIDSAYDGEEFLLNYQITPYKRLATLFTFISSLSSGIIQYDMTNFVDGEFLRMKNLSYY